jgi:2-polyprenyl-3-methyl-5-hydroxy-6-metoxy-1,4-benzoquinol methylase
MAEPDRRAHWDGVYRTKRENEVSWFQASPTASLDLIHAAGVERHASIIDIGGGASRLVDALSDEGFTDLTVLDVSEAATETAKARLGARATDVTWIVADVTQWEPKGTYDVWHDRAAFHFLTAPEDRAAYAERVLQAVRPGGHIIIGTFALDGPERCSGLPVVRHDADSIGAVLGPSFKLTESRRHDHQTPMGGSQKFQFSRFQRAHSGV